MVSNNECNELRRLRKPSSQRDHGENPRHDHVEKRQLLLRHQERCPRARGVCSGSRQGIRLHLQGPTEKNRRNTPKPGRCCPTVQQLGFSTNPSTRKGEVSLDRSSEPTENLGNRSFSTVFTGTRSSC